jgi:hypothetical protein
MVRDGPLNTDPNDEDIESHEDIRSEKEILEHWTQERLESAQPLPLPSLADKSGPQTEQVSEEDGPKIEVEQPPNEPTP